MEQDSLRSAVPRRIDGPFDPKIHFSICTLVTNEALYRAMCESFRRGGFDGADVEFLYIDNTSGNAFEAYEGLNCLISHARGQYVILCHQDVVLIDDGREALLDRLHALEALDPTWALAGNAGGLDHRRVAIRITDRSGTYSPKDLPQRAISLDENFIVMRSASRLGFSRDLEGFHLYGTDICLQAEVRGWSAYVIDFHLRHDGQGEMGESFSKCQAELEEKYGRFMGGRAVRTTCTTVRLVPSLTRRAAKRRVEDLRWYRRAIWKWLRGKPVPPRD